MSSPNMNLEYLLAPVAPEEFFAQHWERRPLVVARDDAARYAGLLDASDIEHVITSACEQKSTVELLGEPEGASSVAQAESASVVLKAFRRGATVRVHGVQRLQRSLGTLCRELEQLFGFPVNANLYCTPAASQGAQLHYDTHDVLVLQLRGRKRWRVFPPLVELPLAHLPPLPFEERGPLLKYRRGGPRKGRADIREEDCGELLHDLTLAAGDLLYLPRGFVHDARAADEPSVHVTLGVHALTWLDLLAVALGQVSNRDGRFRRALPVGLHTNAPGDLNEQLAALVEAFARQADARAAADEVAGSFIHSRQSLGEGVLSKTGAPEEFDARTTLERRPGLLCRFVVEGATAGLVAAHAELWMPANFAPALRFVARAGRFRAAELPGPMSDESKLALARRLMKDGFLRVARE